MAQKQGRDSSLKDLTCLVDLGYMISAQCQDCVSISLEAKLEDRVLEMKESF